MARTRRTSLSAGGKKVEVIEKRNSDSAMVAERLVDASAVEIGGREGRNQTVVDEDDVAGLIGVDDVDERREGRGLSRARRTRDKDQT